MTPLSTPPSSSHASPPSASTGPTATEAPRPSRRVLLMGALMAATAGASWLTRPRRADVPPPDLERLVPRRLGPWAIDQQAEVFVKAPETLGRAYGLYDRVLERVYVDDRGQRVMLSIAYGGEQSEALQVHRPEVCYAGSGFRVGPVRSTTLALGVGPSLPVRQLHALAPGRSEPVTYWVVLGGEVLTEESALRWRRIQAGVRGQVLAGMLVRVSTLHRDAEAAWPVHTAFAAEMARALPAADRAQLYGRA